MYIPSPFTSPSDQEIEELVRDYPFATLITPHETEAEASHVPLLLETRDEGWVLTGHLARANAHWRFLEGGESLAIFHGPQAYVSPLWYECAGVPTWNYVVAHLRGRASLLSGEEDTLHVLRQVSARLEGEKGWRFQVPDDLAKPGLLSKHIVAFEIRVSSKAGKFKLSQNRSSADHEGVMAGLATRKDEQSLGVLRWMQRLAKRTPASSG